MSKLLFRVTLFVIALLPALSFAADSRLFVVGFAQDNLANDWRKAQVREMEEALAKESGIHFIHSDAGGRTAQQILDVEEMVARRVDVLVTSPRDGRALTPAIAAAHAAGIPVVLLTRRVVGDAYTTFVGLDDHTIARDAARRLVARLNGKGKVLVLQGLPTATTAIARTEGFMEEIARHPGMEVVAVKPANYLRPGAIRAVEEALAEGLEFDAIYAQSDSMASGARLALAHAGVDPKGLAIVGIDYISEAREAIRAGTQDASFSYPTCGTEGAEMVMAILRGETVPRERLVESRMITQENVEEIVPIF